MKDYQKMWESLKVKIEADLRFHESGKMQSMAEAFEGENKCREVLKYMESLEEMIPEVDDDFFVCIKASELSLSDEFMQHRPNSKREQVFKDSLEDVIKNGIEDFWRPRIDPMLDEDENIRFKVGKKAAVGHSYYWWRNNAKKFNRKRKSRLGTKSQYIAFLGVLIKALVAEGWTVAEAWNAVCNDSRKLGHYFDSENGNYDVFEPTGSRAVAGFFDLANTHKLLAGDEEYGKYGDFWLAGGSIKIDGRTNPLADLYHFKLLGSPLDDAVGWIVLS